MNEEIRNENLETVIQDDVSQEQPKKTMLVAKIIVAVITVLAMGWLLYLDVDIMIEMQTNGWAALAWAVIISFYAPVLCGVSLIVSAINLVIAIVRIKKGLVSKGTLVYFICFTIIPIVIFAFSVWGIPIFFN